MSSRRAVIVPVLAAGIFGAAASAQAQIMATQTLLTGLTRPVYVTAPPNDPNRLFIVQKGGQIRIYNLATSLLNGGNFLNLSASIVGNTSVGDERGLLGLAFHPDYASNRKFYVYYSAPKMPDIPVTWDHESRVYEYTAVNGNPDLADTGSARLILRFGQPQSNHNGGWIGFGPDGYLYISSGDGGNFNDQGTGHTEPGGNAQDISDNWLGKLLRVDVDGVDDFPADANRNYAVPPSNPLVGVAGDDEIWAFGLRNVWRPSFDRVTGDLYIADVGQNAIEEINFQPFNSSGGQNYGWRCMEGLNCTGFSGCTCNAPALTLPIHTYSHTGGNCSVTGGYVYRGTQICAARGLYFFMDYCSAQVWTIRVVGGVATELTNRTAELDPPGATVLSNLVSFGEDAKGEMYIVSQSAGNIYKIVKPCPKIDIDGDCDGDATDVALFPDVLLNIDTNSTHRKNSDMNCDNTYNGDDIQIFCDSLF